MFKSGIWETIIYSFTLEGVPTDAPQNMTGRFLNDDIVKIVYYAPPEHARNRQITKYEIQIWLAVDPEHKQLELVLVIWFWMKELIMSSKFGQTPWKGSVLGPHNRVSEQSWTLQGLLLMSKQWQPVTQLSRSVGYLSLKESLCCLLLYFKNIIFLV